MQLQELALDAVQRISIQGTIPDELLTINRVMLSGLALTGPLPELSYQLPDMLAQSYPTTFQDRFAAQDDAEGVDMLSADASQQQQVRRVRRPLEWQMLRNSGLRPLQPHPQHAGNAAAAAAASTGGSTSRQHTRQRHYGSSSSRSPRNAPAGSGSGSSGSGGSSFGPMRQEIILLLADQQITGGFTPSLSVFWLFEHCFRFPSWLNLPQSIVSFAVPADGQLAVVLPASAAPESLVNRMKRELTAGQTSVSFQLQQQQQGEAGSSSSSSKQSWSGGITDVPLVYLKVNQQRGSLHAGGCE
jgi:hypothetical protein